MNKNIPNIAKLRNKIVTGKDRAVHHEIELLAITLHTLIKAALSGNDITTYELEQAKNEMEELIARTRQNAN